MTYRRGKRLANPVVDGKGGDLKRHRDHVDGAVQQRGLKLLLEVDLLRPEVEQHVKVDYFIGQY